VHRPEDPVNRRSRKAVVGRQGVLMAIVDVALVLLLVGNQTGSVAATRAGGWFVFAFVAFVIYFYVAALWEETGGRALPLGRPLVT